MNTFEIATSVTVIDQKCFLNDIGLQSFKIAPSTITIEMNCFEGCTSLRKLIIPPQSNLDRIKPYAFEGCTQLEQIELEEKDVFTFENGCLIDYNKTKLIFYLLNKIIYK